jgi:hypothetical protein
MHGKEPPLPPINQLVDVDMGEVDDQDIGMMVGDLDMPGMDFDMLGMEDEDTCADKMSLVQVSNAEPISMRADIAQTFDGTYISPADLVSDSSRVFQDIAKQAAESASCRNYRIARLQLANNLCSSPLEALHNFNCFREIARLRLDVVVDLFISSDVESIEIRDSLFVLGLKFENIEVVKAILNQSADPQQLADRYIQARPFAGVFRFPTPHVVKWSYRVIAGGRLSNTPFSEAI